MKNLWTTFFVAVGSLVTTILGVVLLGLVIGWLLAIVWNFAIPDLFGLPETDWKHMFALFILVRCLFGTGKQQIIKKD